MNNPDLTIDMNQLVMKFIRENKSEELLYMIKNGLKFERNGESGINALIQYSLEVSTYSMNNLTRFLLDSDYCKELKANTIIGLINISLLDEKDSKLVEKAIDEIPTEELEILKSKIYTNSREVLFNSKILDVNVNDLVDINVLNAKILCNIKPMIIYVNYKITDERYYLISIENYNKRIDFIDMFFNGESKSWILKKPYSSKALKCSPDRKITKEELELIFNAKDENYYNKVLNNIIEAKKKGILRDISEGKILQGMLKEQTPNSFKEQTNNNNEDRSDLQTQNNLKINNEKGDVEMKPTIGDSNYKLTSISACATIENEELLDVQHINIQAHSIEELEEKIKESIVDLNEKNDKKVLDTVKEMFKNNKEFKESLLSLIKEIEMK